MEEKITVFSNKDFLLSNIKDLKIYVKSLIVLGYLSFPSKDRK